MSIEEIYCLYNRARGINLISPGKLKINLLRNHPLFELLPIFFFFYFVLIEDLHRSCLLFENTSLEFKEFENGVKIILLRGEEGNLSKKIIEIITKNQGQSSFEIAKKLNIPANLASKISSFLLKKKINIDCF